MGDFADRRGIYNIDYFSGSQVAIYIGDVLVDEITSMNWVGHQSRTPIFGYADELYRDISRGHFLVQGSFTVNFKEAGYLWLVLNRYKEVMKGEDSFLSEIGTRSGDLGKARPFYSPGENYLNSLTIEQMVNGEMTSFERNKIIRQMSAGERVSAKDRANVRANTGKELAGFSSKDRAGYRRKGSLGRAEGIFERFEDQVWASRKDNTIEQHTRRADEPALNNFDIFVTFGDYTGSDHENHTVHKISNVVITGSSKQIVIDGQPIQEVYQFIGRNII